MFPGGTLVDFLTPLYLLLSGQISENFSKCQTCRPDLFRYSKLYEIIERLWAMQKVYIRSEGMVEGTTKIIRGGDEREVRYCTVCGVDDRVSWNFFSL